MELPQEKLYFEVPFSEKELAKRNGAAWDKTRRKWWFPPDKVTDFVKGKWKFIASSQYKKPVATSVSAPDGSGIIRGWFDGGSRGNPGKWGYGAILRHGNGKVIGTRMGSGKYGTNNEAEYKGMISLLEMLREEIGRAPPDPAVTVTLYGDSNLVIRQVSGEWECKSDNLKELCEKAKELLKDLRENYKSIDVVYLEHVLRDKNAEADDLANIAMDRI